MSFTNSRGCPECRHVFPNGKRCHAAALRGKPLCYFHSRNKSVINENRNRASSVALPPLEDHGSIQIAVNEVLAAHAAGKIDRKGIWPYLVGLQIASRNLANAKGNVVSSEPVEDCEEQFGESLAPPAEGDPEVKIESPSSLCLDRIEACAGYTCATHEYDPEPFPLLPEPRQVKPSRWGAFSSRVESNRFRDNSDAWLKGFHAGRSGSNIPAPAINAEPLCVGAPGLSQLETGDITVTSEGLLCVGAPGPSHLMETGELTSGGTGPTTASIPEPCRKIDFRPSKQRIMLSKARPSRPTPAAQARPKKTRTTAEP